MEIKETKWFWNGRLTDRNRTEYIILHHRAGNGTAQSIHDSHLGNGWCGIGYHFYIRKNGEIYRGRPIEKIGAHTEGKNSVSVGVCFEGNYETADREMPKPQLESGKELLSYLKKIYPNAEVMRHKDFGNTACPGKNFPYDELLKGEKEMTVNEAKQILKEKAGLSDKTLEFLLCYKYGEDLILKLAKATKG